MLNMMSTGDVWLNMMSTGDAKTLLLFMSFLVEIFPAEVLLSGSSCCCNEMTPI
jgi:hypothetical protein